MLSFVAFGHKHGRQKKAFLSSKNAPFPGQNANLTNGTCLARPPPPPTGTLSVPVWCLPPFRRLTRPEAFGGVQKFLCRVCSLASASPRRFIAENHIQMFVSLKNRGCSSVIRWPGPKENIDQAVFTVDAKLTDLVNQVIMLAQVGRSFFKIFARPWSISPWKW